MSIHKSILNYIKRLPKGRPFTTASLVRFGIRSNIDKVLSRLVASCEVVRLARGVFVRVEKSAYVGEVLPSPIEVVNVIAKTNKSLIQVHGAEAARMLELTTQAPTKPIFNTTGPSKMLRVGNLEVTLKHISPRKIIFPNTQAGLAISALWYLGKKQVNRSTIEKISQKISVLEFSRLKKSIHLLPAWMANAIYVYEHGKPL